MKHNNKINRFFTSKKCSISILGLLYSTLALYSCSKTDEPVPANQSRISEILISQSRLDSVTVVSESRDTLITGNPFSAREVEAQGNFRSVFSLTRKEEGIRAGEVIAIRSFANNNGRRGQLLFVDVMVKREVGYNPSGNDFEYMRIMFDPTVDYQLHPNGMVPGNNQTTLRGLGNNIMSVDCVSCHRTTSDFVFYN